MCQITFEQMTRKGALRKMCSEACTLKRIYHRRRDTYREWYGKLREAGASRAMAHWASSGGKVRFDATIDVLKEST